jgi:3-oxoacyl-[acyl-carrier protein] reductase
MSLLSPLFILMCYSSTFSSLTAAKEAGASIEIDGKKVALGVPGAQGPGTAAQTAEQYSFIPLRRGGTPEDAAASVLLYVSYVLTRATDFQYVNSLASPLASYVSGHTLEVTGGVGI